MGTFKKALVPFIVCLSIQAPSWANGGVSAIPHDYFEVGFGTGAVNDRFTKFAGFVKKGYKNYILTGRVCRSSADEYRGYIFEYAFLMGYRLGLGKFFNTSLSGGCSQLAFEKGYHTYFKTSPDKFNRTKGFSLETEAEWKIPSQKGLSPLSLSLIYYTTFNSLMNLNGFMVAFKFCPERFKEHWYTQK